MISSGILLKFKDISEYLHTVQGSVAESKQNEHQAQLPSLLLQGHSIQKTQKLYLR